MSTYKLGGSSTLPSTERRHLGNYLGVSALTVVSVLSFIFFHEKGYTLLYADSISHMGIARRVVDSPVTGFGQLGTVWLPLPHLLMLPFIWSNTLYYDGIAGSIGSMLSFVIAVVYVYKIVADLTGSRLAAVSGGFVFLANPGVLYMQSTPMTELMLLACMAAMVYYTQRWIRTQRNVDLVAAAVACFLGTLSRFEGWVLMGALACTILITAACKRFGRVKTEGTFLSFLFIGGLGILGWLAWNQLLVGNPLDFENGPYARPSLWIGKNEAAVGHLWVSIQTYWYAMTDDLNFWFVLIMAAGILAILVKERFALWTLPALATLAFVPFFVWTLYGAQRPIHVTQIDPDLYNVRFGMVMVLPAAIFVGYLTSLFGRRLVPQIVLSVAAIGLAGFLAAGAWQKPASIATLREPLVWQSHRLGNTELKAAKFLMQNYRRGIVLAQFSDNEEVLFRAHISEGVNLYEGSYRLWMPALADPPAYKVRWIVMRKTPGKRDAVFTHLYGRPTLSTNYRLVYHNQDYNIYRRM